MRIHLLSDLHLEFADLDVPKVDVDLVILAGDIAKGVQGIAWAKRTFNVPVIYVAGNHEYYIDRRVPVPMEDTPQAMRFQAQGTHVHFLENEAVTIGDVRFLGATTWTDFYLYGDAHTGMEAASSVMSDFRGAIITRSECYLRAENALDWHRFSKNWLQK